MESITLEVSEISRRNVGQTCQKGSMLKDRYVDISPIIKNKVPNSYADYVMTNYMEVSCCWNDVRKSIKKLNIENIPCFHPEGILVL